MSGDVWCHSSQVGQHKPNRARAHPCESAFGNLTPTLGQYSSMMQLFSLVNCCVYTCTPHICITYSRIIHTHMQSYAYTRIYVIITLHCHGPPEPAGGHFYGTLKFPLSAPPSPINFENEEKYTDFPLLGLALPGGTLHSYYALATVGSPVVLRLPFFQHRNQHETLQK